MLDRAAGALVGLAVGDALGAGYEFTGGTDDPKMIGGGAFGFEPGEWTDDTQMAVCIAEEAATGTLDPLAVGARFIAWLREGPKDVGIQTRSVLGGVGGPSELPSAAATHFERSPQNSAGNGSLMRTAPVALAYLDDEGAMVEAARTISGLTHGDPLAAEACVLWCVAIRRAIREGRLDGIYEGLNYLETDAAERWRDWLDEAATRDPSSFTPNGFVVPALQAAYSAVLATAPSEDAEMPCVHLRDGLRRAISIGGDTDTVAAIAGQLLGARYGVSAVPAEWLAVVHGWPKPYRVPDLVRLAILSAQHGGAGSEKWPSAAHLKDEYERTGGCGPGAIRLNEDDEVWLGGFAALEEAERFDVVVSLCRVGREDTPGEGIRIAPRIIDAEGENPNLDFLLSDLARQICSWRDQGKSVLIQCARAQRRTPAVAAAYLAERFSLSGDQGWRQVEDFHPGVRENPDFIDALDRLWG